MNNTSPELTSSLIKVKKYPFTGEGTNVGGSVARTLSFYPATGIGEIRAYGQPVITL